MLLGSQENGCSEEACDACTEACFILLLPVIKWGGNFRGLLLWWNVNEKINALRNFNAPNRQSHQLFAFIILQDFLLRCCLLLRQWNRGAVVGVCICSHSPWAGSAGRKPCRAQQGWRAPTLFSRHSDLEKCYYIQSQHLFLPREAVYFLQISWKYESSWHLDFYWGIF